MNIRTSAGVSIDGHERFGSGGAAAHRKKSMASIDCGMAAASAAISGAAQTSISASAAWRAASGKRQARRRHEMASSGQRAQQSGIKSIAQKNGAWRRHQRKHAGSNGGLKVESLCAILLQYLGR